MPPKKTYVAGFLFSPDRSRVLLIRKNRPAWQAGKLNGLGGKIEPGETPPQAMRREFREEQGGGDTVFVTDDAGRHAVSERLLVAVAEVPHAGDPFESGQGLDVLGVGRRGDPAQEP